MLLNKKVSIGVVFAQKKAYEYEGKKFEADVKNGDIVTVLNEGITTAGSPQYGSKEQVVFKIKTRNGEKGLPFNQTSINNMVDVYGGETSEWVGKEIKVWVDKVMGKDGYKHHVFIAPLGTERDEETGLFISQEVSQENAQAVSEDELGDIDFEGDLDDAEDVQPGSASPFN